MEKKYYEYGFYYDYVRIKNITPVKLKVIHLPLWFPLLFQNCSNNESYDF